MNNDPYKQELQRRAKEATKEILGAVITNLRKLKLKGIDHPVMVEDYNAGIDACINYLKRL